MSPTALQLVLGEEELLVERAVEAIVAEVRAVDPDGRAAQAPRGRDHACRPGREPLAVAVRRGSRRRAARRARGGQGPHGGGARAWRPISPRAWCWWCSTRAARATRRWSTRCARRSPPSPRAIGSPATRSGRSSCAARRGGRAGGSRQAAVPVLIEAVGSDLRELAAATAQLVADTGGTVDESAVRRYYRGRAESSGFAVADKVIVGDRAGALEALRWAQVLGVPSVLIADALADAVRTLARVGAAGRGDPNRLAGSLGMPPWKIRKAQQQVRHWSPGALGRCVRGRRRGQRRRQGRRGRCRLRARTGGAAHLRGPWPVAPGLKASLRFRHGESSFSTRRVAHFATVRGPTGGGRRVRERQEATNPDGIRGFGDALRRGC